MKKILITLILVLFSLVGSAQSQSVVLDYNSYNKWVTAQSGPGAFLISVVANQQKQSDGYYYFDLYAFSNATNSYGYLTSAYIQNVNVTFEVYDKYTNTSTWKPAFYLEYILVQPKTEYYNGMYRFGYVYSTNPYQKIKVTYTRSIPY